MAADLRPLQFLNPDLTDGRINGTLECPQLLRRRSPAAVERRVAVALAGHPADLAEKGRKQATEKNNVSTAYYGRLGKPAAIRGNPIKRNFFDCGSGGRWFVSIQPQQGKQAGFSISPRSC
jgi:hypothetical protein